MLVEWDLHNFAYALKPKRERTADTDFNDKDEGRGRFGYVKDYIKKQSMLHNSICCKYNDADVSSD